MSEGGSGIISNNLKLKSKIQKEPENDQEVESLDDLESSKSNNDSQKNSINENSQNNNNNVNLASAVPSAEQQKLNENFDLVYDGIPYILLIYINDDNNLEVELLPREGHIPHSYHNIFNVEYFYKKNPIFTQFKTIDAVKKKLVVLCNKGRVSIAKNSKEDEFFLILKITIIDEDKEIKLPLKKNETMQICTVQYLLRETGKLKIVFAQYKTETEKIIKKQTIEIESLKKFNDYYLKIINKLKEEKKIEIDINDKNLFSEDRNIYENCQNKINKLESELILLNDKNKIDFYMKNIEIYLTVNQAKSDINIGLNIENTGNNSINISNDEFYYIIENESSENFGFIKDENNNEQNILNFNNEFKEIKPKQIITNYHEFILDSPELNEKYEIYLCLYSINNGKMTDIPAHLTIKIRDDYKNNQHFLAFLREDNKFDFKNKIIVFEYEKNPNDGNKNVNNKDKEGKNNNKVSRYVYDQKNGINIEKNYETNDVDDKIEVVIKIDKEDVDKIIQRLDKQYQVSKKVERKKIEEIILTYFGDYKKIVKKIKNMI